MAYELQAVSLVFDCDHIRFQAHTESKIETETVASERVINFIIRLYRFILSFCFLFRLRKMDRKTQSSSDLA